MDVRSPTQPAVPRRIAQRVFINKFQPRSIFLKVEEDAVLVTHSTTRPLNIRSFDDRTRSESR